MAHLVTFSSSERFVPMILYYYVVVWVEEFSVWFHKIGVLCQAVVTEKMGKILTSKLSQPCWFFLNCFKSITGQWILPEKKGMKVLMHVKLTQITVNLTKFKKKQQQKHTNKNSMLLHFINMKILNCMPLFLRHKICFSTFGYHYWNLQTCAL